jgi:hypothetical protein
MTYKPKHKRDMGLTLSQRLEQARRRNGGARTQTSERSN